ncbi:3 beta-hydroxysteroid dehydrogenase type 7-like [Branchiostoma floridae]|uniref:3 beta-hydroxysteroid dehydrogenase type 7-like n=1 Tax=Branchiostoma floridae TaxID=7739 RepID=A0A9J7M3X4_BRAFL|nr:3 beta-hydroxysteroid dehydrogenase type 7-like [Branchiostoma floridae]
MTPGLTYVVAGGCGFLGARIVDMLAERAENISEIRVVDKNLRSRLSTADREGVKVSLIRGDVTDMAQMTEVCGGADVVIHTASLIDFLGLVSDATLWHINVKGTENLLQCCVNEDIPSFVYTSTIEAVGPNRRGDPLVDGDESTPYDSSSPLLPYGRTKAAAEAMVLQWNGRRTNGGKTLHTCSLRPGGVLKKRGSNLFTRPMRRACSTTVKVSRQYVGNVAWAHLLAAQTLVTSPKTAGGEAINISDDTPLKDDATLLAELCAPIGIRWNDNLVLPLWLLYVIANVLALIRFVVKPFYTFVPPLNSDVLTIQNTTFYFNYKKATRVLGYKPIFTWEESKQRTSDWLVKWKAREFS